MADPNMQLPELADADKETLFAWVDEFKLSRPKRNFTTFFSKILNNTI